MSEARALRLAGDIAAQLRHLPDEDAAARLATHIRMFWDPRMHAQLHEQLAATDGADPVVASAAALLDAP